MVYIPPFLVCIPDSDYCEQYSDYAEKCIPVNIPHCARGRPRRAILLQLAMHVCVNAMLLMRVPVHGVGESDRPSQVYSDMKYIFCEYLRPFAAREERARGRARSCTKTKTIYGEPTSTQYE